jgi:hypothetical protein
MIWVVPVTVPRFVGMDCGAVADSLQVVGICSPLRGDAGTRIFRIRPITGIFFYFFDGKRIRSFFAFSFY